MNNLKIATRPMLPIGVHAAKPRPPAHFPQAYGRLTFTGAAA